MDGSLKHLCRAAASFNKFIKYHYGQKAASIGRAKNARHL
jgi:hypothetical protein